MIFKVSSRYILGIAITFELLRILRIYEKLLIQTLYLQYI